MFGVGTADTTLLHLFRIIKMFGKMGGRAVAIGTDANGFEKLPRHARIPNQQASNTFLFTILSRIRHHHKAKNRKSRMGLYNR